MNLGANFIAKSLSMKMPIKFYPFILIPLILFNCGSSEQNAIELQEEKLNHILDSYVKSGVYPFLYARVEGESGTVYEHAVTNEDLFGNLKIDGDTWIRIWSMSKLVTISVAMDLIEENKLSLSDPVIKYIPEFKDLKVAVDKSISLRYFNPVGSVKDLPKCKPRQDSKNLMDNIVDVCTGQTKNLTIFGDDYSTSDGTAERDYIHIEDLVYAHFEALNYFNHINGFDVFNIGTGKSVSVKQIVKTFKESNEVDFAVEISKRREGDVPICYADANKAKKLLNWETKKSLREMCIDAWSCYK